MEVVDAHMHLWTTKTHKWVAEVKNGGHPAGPFGERGFPGLLPRVLALAARVDRAARGGIRGGGGGGGGGRRVEGCML